MEPNPAMPEASTLRSLQPEPSDPKILIRSQTPLPSSPQERPRLQGQRSAQCRVLDQLRKLQILAGEADEGICKQPKDFLLNRFLVEYLNLLYRYQATGNKYFALTPCFVTVIVFLQIHGLLFDCVSGLPHQFDLQGHLAVTSSAVYDCLMYMKTITVFSVAYCCLILESWILTLHIIQEQIDGMMKWDLQLSAILVG